MKTSGIARLVLPWSAFNALGRNRIVKSSYVWAALVPILAKMLSGISQDYELPVLGSSLHVVLGVPFTWELLYYSSVFFAVATLIYAVCCPEIVKIYDRHSDFQAEGKGSDQLISYAYGVSSDRLRKSGRPWLTKGQLLRFLKAYADHKQGMDLNNPIYLEYLNQVPIHQDFLPENNRVTDDNLHAAFWFIRDCADQHSPVLRFVVGVFYVIGFVLFSWVMVQNFWYVVSLHLMRHG